jgi:hypothetical protein
MAFGDHLGPDHDIDFAGIKPVQEFFMGAFSPDGVSIHPRDPGLGETDLELVFNLLGALTQEL